MYEVRAGLLALQNMHILAIVNAHVVLPIEMLQKLKFQSLHLQFKYGLIRHVG